MPRTISNYTVVITDQHDAHIPFVEKHLNNRLVIIDPLEMVAGKELSFSIASQIVTTYDGKTLENVTGVWFRKPQPIIRNDLPVENDYKPYSHQSLERHFMQLTTAFEKAFWISDYFAMNRANNKTLQLAIARDIGLNIPDTIFTSDKREADAFAATHPQFISKPLIIGLPLVNGKQKILLTTLFDTQRQADFTHLHFAPTILQEAIDVKDDVRVIVVGNDVFAATVNSNYERTKENEHLRDNRAGHYEGTVTIKKIKLPQLVASQCIAHVRRLGLHFGAIDMLVDRQGKWWFLENNPNGQWAYIEHETGQPIGKAIARLLDGTARL